MRTLNRWKQTDQLPEDVRIVRAWDKAATPEAERGEKISRSARTAGVAIGEKMLETGPTYFICHAVAARVGTDERMKLTKAVAEEDRDKYGPITTWLEGEGGSASDDR